MDDVLNPTYEELCDVSGLELLCESPLEIGSSGDESVATGDLAEFLLCVLANKWQECAHDLETMKDMI